MNDVHVVLYRKEQDLERVRKEVQALLAVIPLLEDDQLSPDAVYEMLVSSPMSADSVNKGMDDLERYYPFVRKLQKAGQGTPAKPLLRG